MNETTANTTESSWKDYYKSYEAYLEDKCDIVEFLEDDGEYLACALMEYVPVDIFMKAFNKFRGEEYKAYLEESDKME